MPSTVSMIEVSSAPDQISSTSSLKERACVDTAVGSVVIVSVLHHRPSSDQAKHGMPVRIRSLRDIRYQHGCALIIRASMSCWIVIGCTPAFLGLSMPKRVTLPVDMTSTNSSQSLTPCSCVSGVKRTW